MNRNAIAFVCVAGIWIWVSGCTGSQPSERVWSSDEPAGTANVDRNMVAGPVPGPTLIRFPDGSEAVRAASTYAEESRRANAPCVDHEVRIAVWHEWTIPGDLTDDGQPLPASGLDVAIGLDKPIADGPAGYHQCRRPDGSPLNPYLAIRTEEGPFRLKAVSVVFDEVDFDTRSGEVDFHLRIVAVSDQQFVFAEVGDTLDGSPWQHLDGTLVFEIEGMALIERFVF